jgi:hypothetical protein
MAIADPNRATYRPAQVTLLTETAATRQNILAAFDQIITLVQHGANKQTIPN